MDANPDVIKYADVAAGHGYNIPHIPYEFPIVPYDKAVKQGLKVWLTEISSALDNYDGSMEMPFIGRKYSINIWQMPM